MQSSIVRSSEATACGGAGAVVSVVAAVSMVRTGTAGRSSSNGAGSGGSGIDARFCGTPVSCCGIASAASRAGPLCKKNAARVTHSRPIGRSARARSVQANARRPAARTSSCKRAHAREAASWRAPSKLLISTGSPRTGLWGPPDSSRNCLTDTASPCAGWSSRHTNAKSWRSTNAFRRFLRGRPDALSSSAHVAGITATRRERASGACVCVWGWRPDLGPYSDL